MLPQDFLNALCTRISSMTNWSIRNNIIRNAVEFILKGNQAEEDNLTNEYIAQCISDCGVQTTAKAVENARNYLRI